MKQLSQLEYAIYQKIKQNAMLNFFPIGRARVLEKDEEAETTLQRERELLNRLEKLERKVSQLTKETRKQTIESYLTTIYEYIKNSSAQRNSVVSGTSATNPSLFSANTNQPK